MLIAFEGHSDDTFGWSLVGERPAGHRSGDDYDNSASGKPIVWRVERDGHGLYVWGLYSPANTPRVTPACWVIGIQQLDEGHPLPDWQMTWATAESKSTTRREKFGYSPVLMLEVPDDTLITIAR